MNKYKPPSINIIQLYSFKYYFGALRNIVLSSATVFRNKVCCFASKDMLCLLIVVILYIHYDQISLMLIRSICTHCIQLINQRLTLRASLCRILLFLFICMSVWCLKSERGHNINNYTNIDTCMIPAGIKSLDISLIMEIVLKYRRVLLRESPK